MERALLGVAPYPSRDVNNMTKNQREMMNAGCVVRWVGVPEAAVLSATFSREMF